MSANLDKNARFIKRAARGRGGAVASKNQTAADLGARVLSEGGNAVDAAVATALALAVLEPWTSGLGSAGCMTIWDNKKRRGYFIDFPAALPPHSSDLRAAGGTLHGGDDVQDENSESYRTIAIPGAPDGLWAAHAFGTKPWHALVAPAVDLSEQGFEVDWYAFLTIMLAATELARYPSSREWFLPNGFPPSHLEAGDGTRLRNPALTEILKSLAERGGRDFYEGLIAHALVDDLARGGSLIAKADLRTYRARVVDPAVMPCGGKCFLLPPESKGAEQFCNLMRMETSAPFDLNDALFVNRAKMFSAAHADLSVSGSDLDEWSTHVSIIDGCGNMVSLAQSLGSLFGSKIVLPTTGILANDWAASPRTDSLDQRPRTAQHNFLPVLGLSGERAWLAIGVAGNRHALPIIVQLTSLLGNFGFSLEDAFHQPRICISREGQVLIDSSASRETKQALHRLFGALEIPAVIHPFARPCAVAVSIDPFSGEQVAMTEATELWAGEAAVAQTDGR